jgi:hypothetical protein
MEIPGLGTVTTHPDVDEWYYSQSIAVPVLGGIACQFIVDGYDDDRRQGEFHEAIANFLRISPDVLKEVEPEIFQYYQDCNSECEPGDEWYVSIESPSDIWRHVRLGSEPVVTRNPYGDKGIYISLSCNCDWEREHGLLIVFKNGLRVCKIGPYDGHLTNSNAYNDKKLEAVVYRRR